MSYSTQDRKFLSVLRELNIDIELFPDKTFDCLFDNSPDDFKHFLKWFCENVDSNNALTEGERAAYNEIEKSGLIVPEDELEYLISNCSPSYEDVQEINKDLVKYTLEEELKELSLEYQKLSDVFCKMEKMQNQLKDKQILLKEECSGWKKKLTDAKQDCRNINLSINNMLGSVTTLLQTAPCISIDLSTYLQFSKIEEKVHNILKAHPNQLHDNLSTDRSPFYTQLEEDLSRMQLHKILSEGKLEEKERIRDKLVEILGTDPKERVTVVSQITQTPNFSCSEDSLLQLEKEICDLESNQLPIETKKLSELELCHILNHHQLDKLYSNQNLISKLSYYKEYLLEDKKWDELLCHTLMISTDKTKEKNKLMNEYYSKFYKDSIAFSNLIEKMSWRDRKFKKILSYSSEKHPFLVAMQRVVGSTDNVILQEQVPSFLSSIRLLMENPVVTPQNFYNDVDENIKFLLRHLICGPTSQVLFTPVHVQAAFLNCQELVKKFSQEIQQLTNEYLKVKTAVAQTDRHTLMLWTLFLRKPKELEENLRKIQTESIKREENYSKCH